MVLEHNGEVVATASGAASLGHPAAAVAWLVRSLAAENEGLRAGDGKELRLRSEVPGGDSNPERAHEEQCNYESDSTRDSRLSLSHRDKGLDAR